MLTTAALAAPAEPRVAPVFTPLPLGRVEPAGWLRDWAMAARDGITGHLDERHAVYRDGWKGIPIAWTGANPDGTGWPLEQSAYWLDGALRLGFILHDEPLIQKIRARLDPIVDGVNKAPAGISFVYWKHGWKPQGFDSWAHSHMGRALLALHSGTGEQRVLDALTKVYADYPSDMGGVGLGDVSGLCNLDPMMETYALTGDRRILDRAVAAIKRPDVSKTLEAWAAGKVDCGHLVITYEDIRLPAVMFPWTGDHHDLQATANAFRFLEENHQLPFGVASGEEFTAGVGALRKTETCDIPAMLLVSNWMYRIEGAGSWGDRMEKAFFNAAPAPIARDFQTLAYYQSPNRIHLGDLPAESPNPGPGGLAFGPLACGHVLCCIGASNRILPSYLANMWMATADHGLAATLYGPCKVRSRVGDSDVDVQIQCATDYPFNESIRLTVDMLEPAAFPLYLRQPGWCKAPVITVNGERVAAPAAAGKQGFVCINRTWRKGDVVMLQTPMKVMVARGVEGSYPQEQRGYFHQIPESLFRKRSLPYASVHYGPLLFALPIPEKDANTPVDNASWQYALDLNPDDAAQLTASRTAMPPHWDWPLDSPLTLRVPVRKFDWQPNIEHALPAMPVTSESAATVTLVPYGCTKFHLTMFPVTARTWQGMPLPDPSALDPELSGNAGLYDDPAATHDTAVGYLDLPGSAAIWRHLPPGKQLKIRYAALNNAQLTLHVNDTAPQKVTFPATGKWQGTGAYAEVIVPVTIPANATVRLTYEAGDAPANIDELQTAK